MDLIMLDSQSGWIGICLGSIMIILGTIVLYLNIRKLGLVKFVSGLTYFSFIASLLGFLISFSMLTDVNDLIYFNLPTSIFAVSVGFLFGILAVWKSSFGKVCSALAAPIYIAMIFSITENYTVLLVVLILATILLVIITIRKERFGIAINTAIIGSGLFTQGFSSICKGVFVIVSNNSRVSRSDSYPLAVIAITELVIIIVFTWFFAILFILEVRKINNDIPEFPLD